MKVAVAGATGAVGREILKVLEDREFPVTDLRLLASERSAGKKLAFRGSEVEVQVLAEDSFTGTDMAFFSAGGDLSRKFVPHAVKAGAIAIDNSSAFRMDAGVPLRRPVAGVAMGLIAEGERQVILTDILGLDWDHVHEEACRLEHATSPLVEERLAQFLGQPETCPQGTWCDTGDGQCKPGCDSNEDCTPPEACNYVTHQCGQVDCCGG